MRDQRVDRVPPEPLDEDGIGQLDIRYARNVMSPKSKSGKLFLVGLPVSGDVDDLSTNALRAIRAADVVVYPGIHLATGWKASLDLESRLVTGRRLTTVQLLDVLLPPLRDGGAVVLLVQGDPVWFGCEPGIRACAFALVAHIEALGYSATVLPGLGALSATCAAARLDLFNETQPGGVLVTTPVGRSAEGWASEAVRALAEGITVVALMAEKYTGAFLLALDRQGLSVDCWLGAPVWHPPRRLVLPRDSGELNDVRVPTTIVLRAKERTVAREAGDTSRRALVLLVEDEKALVERCLHPLVEQISAFDQIILALDQTANSEPHNPGLPSGLSWTWLRNSRSPGSAGSFNTGALHILASTATPERHTVVMVDARSGQVPIPPLDEVIPTSVFPGGICVKLDELLMAGLFCEHEAAQDLDLLSCRLQSIGVAVNDLRPDSLGQGGPVGSWMGARLSGTDPQFEPPPVESMVQPPPHSPFAIYVGVISADPQALEPLLRDLVALRSTPSITRIVPVVLENGAARNDIRELVARMRREGHILALVSEKRQREDAAALAFGAMYQQRPQGQVGIAQARTMLQRYLGELMRADQGSFAWILDDDMRVDNRAEAFLPWLPAFRDAGVDALIGGHEGSSPNPPLNGIRVQLVDIWHNLMWLLHMDGSSLLPNRSAENRAHRLRYPDYYYDLSRKHTGHLESPQWLEPAFPGETVTQAHARLVNGALGILSGTPLTRPVIVEMPRDPLASAYDSVNRGGCTFVTNHRTLTDSPNAVVRVGGREARRSDMVWAIINRYHYGMTIKRVGFPVLHNGHVTDRPELDLGKVTGEIVGSAFYGAFTDFLTQRQRQDLDFSVLEIEQICTLVEQHVERRLRTLELNFYRIRGLTVAIRELASHGNLDPLIEHLHQWFAHDSFRAIENGVRTVRRDDFGEFLSSLRQSADAYAAATLQVDFVLHQTPTAFSMRKSPDEKTGPTELV